MRFVRLGVVTISVAIMIAFTFIDSDFTFRMAGAQDVKCGALATDLKGLEAEHDRLVKKAESSSGQGEAILLRQARELEPVIQEKRRQLAKCAGPTMCNGMRACTAEENKTPPALVVDFPGPNGMHLRGYLYVPGVSTFVQLTRLTKKYPAMIVNHGSEQDASDARNLGKLYVDHGFILFVPHRHGHGLSKEAGPWIVEQERQAHSDLFTLELHELANKDVMAAVNWLKRQPYVDTQRIAMTGGSYGGIQTLLTADKDPGLRAYIAFTPGTQSWGIAPLRNRLIEAVRNEKAPMFIIQNEGDYSIAPLTTLGPILLEKGNPVKWKAKLYPAFGCNNEDAHAKFGGTCGGIAIWSPDGLAFLDQWMK